MILIVHSFYITIGYELYYSTKKRENSFQGRLRLGAGGAAAPSALIHGGQELPFILNSLSLQSAAEAFFGIVDSLVQEHVARGKPPDPQIFVVLLEDQCIKHCSFGKEFKDQNLAL